MDTGEFLRLDKRVDHLERELVSTEEQVKLLREDLNGFKRDNKEVHGRIFSILQQIQTTLQDNDKAWIKLLVKIIGGLLVVVLGMIVYIWTRTNH